MLVGLGQKWDLRIILKINNKPSYEFNLNEIMNKFHEKDKKRIKLVIERGGENLKFEFRLKKRI